MLALLACFFFLTSCFRLKRLLVFPVLKGEVTSISSLRSSSTQLVSPSSVVNSLLSLSEYLTLPLTKEVSPLHAAGVAFITLRVSGRHSRGLINPSDYSN